MADNKTPEWRPPDVQVRGWRPPDVQAPWWRRRADDDAEILQAVPAENTEFLAEHAENMRETALAFERTICQKVQRLREGRGWSQADLAQALARLGFDMHQTTVAKLEAGKRPLRVAELVALATIFDLPAAAFLYMPVGEAEPVTMKYMRERLEGIDRNISEAEEILSSLLRTHVQALSDFTAERTVLADMMRSNSTQKRDDDG